MVQRYRLGYQLRQSYRRAAGKRNIGLAQVPINALRWLTPLDYVRYREFAFASDALRRFEATPTRILDVSSPKLLPLSLAYQQPAIPVHAVDVLPSEVRAVREAALSARLPNLSAMVQDARCLSFRADQFSVVTSLSVFEHIAPEERGELPAVQEVGRVVAPGGIVVLTVPFARRYFAEYRRGQVYERAADQQPIFFQRFYDYDRLMRDIVQPSGLQVRSLGFVGERFFSPNPRRRLAHYINNTPARTLLFGPWFPVLAQIFLTAPQPLEACHKPYIACLVLQKP